MLYRCAIILLAVVLARASHAQTWERIGNDNFTYITGCDSALLMISEPGTVLRSEDSGRTWHRVFRSLRSLAAIVQVPGTSQVVLVEDTVAIAQSTDDGRTWLGIPDRNIASPFTREPFPNQFGLPATYLFHSSCLWRGVRYACGEPGLVAVLPDSNRITLLHAAPFRADRQGTMLLDFPSASCGIASYCGELFVTHDSGTSWRPTALRDTSQSALMMLTDTSWLVGLDCGRVALTTDDGTTYSIASLHTSKRIRRIGWRDKLFRELYAVTDSAVYNVSLKGAIDEKRGLAAEQIILSVPPTLKLADAVMAGAYVGFALVDTTTYIDSILRGADGMLHDTILARDTTAIYRTIDGGSSWNIVASGLNGMRHISTYAGRPVYVIGDHGAMCRSEDSGTTWLRVGAMTPQRLNDIAFNDGLGIAVGDSGFVVITRVYRSGMTLGQSWRTFFPEPLFTHLSTCYSRAAIADSHTFYIAGDGIICRATLPDLALQISWNISHPLQTVSRLEIFPNPATDVLHVIDPDGPLIVSDPFGHPFVLPISEDAIDISSLSPGVYFISDGVHKAKFMKK